MMTDSKKEKEKKKKQVWGGIMRKQKTPKPWRANAGCSPH